MLGLLGVFQAFQAKFGNERFFFEDPNAGNPTPTEDRPPRLWLDGFRLTIELGAPARLPQLLGDLNFDGVVNNGDYELFLGDITTRLNSGIGADLNEDGFIDIDDFNMLLPLVLDGTSLVASEAPDTLTQAAPLTQEALAPIVADAVRRWEVELGRELTELDGVSFQIAELDGLRLGQVAGTTVWIDVNAAGHGWFVDPTPWSHHEFNRPRGTEEVWTAKRIGPAVDQMDLLSVVVHELGHVLGFEHEHTHPDHAEESSILDHVLGAGQRILPGLPGDPTSPAGTAATAALRGAGVQIAKTAQVAADAILGNLVKVASKAQIGAGTQIGAGSVIGKGAEIGERVRIGEGVVVDAGAVIPDDAVVLPHSRVSATLGHVTADGDLRSRLRTFFGYGEDSDDADDSKPKRFRFLM
jgi:hypothetical protein